MPFKESLKAKIRKLSDHACCVCRGREGVDVHHVIPQNEDGPDTEENAAPLCTRCHDILGPNPLKRKFIRECRDHWFQECARGQSIGLGIQAIQQALQGHMGSINEIKSLLAAVAVSKSNQKNANRLTLGDYIQHIFGQTVYDAKFEDIDNKLVNALYQMYFCEESWKDDIETRGEFIERFGTETARRLLMHVLSDQKIDLRKGATEEQIEDGLVALKINVALFLMHEDLGASSSIRVSFNRKGALLYRLLKPRTTRAKAKKHSKSKRLPSSLK